MTSVTPNSLEIIPLELQQLCLNQLDDLSDISRFSSLSRCCREIATSDVVWQKIASEIALPNLLANDEKGSRYSLTKKNIIAFRKRAKEMIEEFQTKLGYIKDFKAEIGSFLISDLKMLNGQMKILIVWKSIVMQHIADKKWLRGGGSYNLSNFNEITNEFKKHKTNNKNFLNVTILNLFNCSLTSIPEDVGEFTDIFSLNIGANQITFLFSSIIKLKKLYSINALGNKLKSLPEDLGSLKNLRWLELGFNEFETFPKCIKDLAHLRILNLSGNKLSTLPEFIGNLRGLEELKVKENRLTSIPSSITNLTNLRILDISSNKIKNLTASIGDLLNLQHLLFSDNLIEFFPEAILRLKELKELSASNNRFINVPAAIWCLPKLFRIDLDH